MLLRRSSRRRPTRRSRRPSPCSQWTRSTTHLPDLARAPLAPAAGPVDEAEADEIARQLAMLSPAAAEAVRAAAAAETDEERDAALEAVDDDDRINRGLLLKFLSTVK